MKLIISMHLNQEFAGQIGGKWCFYKVMNLSSFLLCFVFAAIGYVAHPMLLPSLVDSNMIAESSLSDRYKEGQVKKTGKVEPESGEDKKEDIATEDTVPEVIKPEVVEQPTPAIPMTAREPDPVINRAVDEPIDEPVVKLSELAFMNILKSSVKAGEVNEFTFDQVLDWKRAGVEQLDGGTYEVGMVTYQADTIFDEQKLEAKALIKDGKVVKWLWPTTNTKMR